MISNNWSKFIETESQKDYFVKLSKFIDEEYASKVIYPTKDNIFNAFKLTDITDIKVVILGQDPYHEPNEAHGLAFSVQDGIKIPPSLRNIYKEIENEFNVMMINSGDLTYLAKQGVFLLNAVLTVEAHKANSHKNRGWEIFTDNVIKYINENNKNVVYILWGAPAISKMNLIDQTNNLILTSPHPSPLSSYRGFFGNNHFIKANEYLKEHNKKEIIWYHTFN